MIIDFIGENIKNGSFSTTQHFFGLANDCSYEIGVIQIVLETSSTAKASKESLWMLTTNLIDRCSTNPNRAVSYFTWDAYKNRLVINFPSVAFHLLERIHTYPSFEFKSLFDNQKLEITNVIIRAEIRKQCSDLASL